MVVNHMKRLRFARLLLAAYLRGLWHRWPRSAGIPRGYTGCHVALRSWRECWEMFDGLGWEPWCFQLAWDGAPARSFRIPMTAEELAMDDAMYQSYIEHRD
jgi:hypothetical protein